MTDEHTFPEQVSWTEGGAERLLIAAQEEIRALRYQLETAQKAAADRNRLNESLDLERKKCESLTGDLVRARGEITRLKRSLRKGKRYYEPRHNSRPLKRW